MPKNVNILTLEPWGSDTWLLRFEHLMELSDDPKKYSKPVTLNIADIFSNFNIVALRETTLAGNQWLDESDRFIFKEDSKGNDNAIEDKFRATSEKIKKRMIKIKNSLDSDEVALSYEDKNENSIRFNYLTFSGEEIIENEHTFLDTFNVTLGPMQIRTFIVTIKNKG